MSSPLASTSAAAVPVSHESPNSEAPPLPRKVGEIGYVPPAQSEPEMSEVDLNEPSLPARHPADRDHHDEDGSPPSSDPPNPSSSAATPTNDESQPKKNRYWSFGGIRIWSILQLLFLLGLMGGTAGAWWYTIKHFEDSASTNQDQGTSRTGSLGWSSTIFVHAAFSVVALFEIVFFERNIFQIRAERYMFKHGMSPQARRDARRAATLGIAPWNRPPLPTYAAALAESGHGTGDVEDNLIAIVPPPAYGNTRGSVLLLSSMLPSSLLRTFSRASNRSQQNTRPRSPEAGLEEGRRSRPLSYGASEEVDDAARARQLEAALARLESNIRP